VQGVRRFTTAFGPRHLLQNVLTPTIENGSPGSANAESDTDVLHPHAHGLAALSVRIASERGQNLFAWFVPAPAYGPQPTIVLLHGWGGCGGDLMPVARVLHGIGFAVLLIDSRNHGRSDHDDHSSLPRFAQDLDCAINWLSSQAIVNAEQIVALGHSVGGAAVLLAASRRDDLCAATSISAFAHPEALMRRWFATRRVPYWPVGWLSNRYLERVIGARFDDIAPVNTLSKARCPVLLMHGRQDTTVPVDDARHIWAQRRSANATLVEYEGGHSSFDDELAVTNRLVDFLRQALEARM
jgi:uncharacterized protein